MIFFAGPVLGLFGSEFKAAAVSLVILSLGHMVNSLAGPTGNLMNMTGYQKEAAIILAFNPQDSSVAGRRAILEKGALSLDRGLLRIAEDTGISKPLIDTATTAIGAGAGSSLALTMVAKAVYGLPTGSGIHNAPASWPWLRSQRKEHREAYRVCDFSSGLLVVMMGGDFVLYGPIKSAQSVFPVVAMGDMFTAEMASTELGVEPSENHPFRRLV